MTEIENLEKFVPAETSIGVQHHNFLVNAVSQMLVILLQVRLSVPVTTQSPTITMLCTA